MILLPKFTKQRSGVAAPAIYSEEALRVKYLIGSINAVASSRSINIQLDL